jgi:hypothetical protein
MGPDSGRVYLIADLATSLGIEREACAAALAAMERRGWARTFMHRADDYAPQSRPAAMLTARGAMYAPRPTRRRGVIGTFLFQGTEAARVARLAGAPLVGAERKRRKAGTDDEAFEWDLVDDCSEPLLRALRKHGFAGAYNAWRLRRLTRARHKRR